MQKVFEAKNRGSAIAIIGVNKMGSDSFLTLRIIKFSVRFVLACLHMNGEI